MKITAWPCIEDATCDMDHFATFKSTTTDQNSKNVNRSANRIRLLRLSLSCKGCFLIRDADHKLDVSMPYSNEIIRFNFALKAAPQITVALKSWLIVSGTARSRIYESATKLPRMSLNLTEK